VQTYEYFINVISLFTIFRINYSPMLLSISKRN